MKLINSNIKTAEIGTLISADGSKQVLPITCSAAIPDLKDHLPVVEGYLIKQVFYSDEAGTSPIVGKAGFIYVDLLLNGQYRWTGAAYLSISSQIDFATKEEAEAGENNSKAMTALRSKELVESLKGTPNGIAGTDADNKVLSEQLPTNLLKYGDEEFSSAIINDADTLGGKTQEEITIDYQAYTDKSVAKHVLTANRNVYVSNDGNDETGDGSEGNPWATIQKAVDEAPEESGAYLYSVGLSVGTHSGFKLSGKRVHLSAQGPGGITIASTIDVDYGGYLSASIPLTIAPASGVGIRAWRDGAVLFTSGISFVGGTYGISATHGGEVLISGITTFSNCTTAAVVSTRGGKVSLAIIAGSGNKCNLSANGGTISYDSYPATPGTNPDQAINGGIITNDLIDVSQKGAPNGVVPTDERGRAKLDNLPYPWEMNGISFITEENAKLAKLLDDMTGYKSGSMAAEEFTAVITEKRFNDPQLDLRRTAAGLTYTNDTQAQKIGAVRLLKLADDAWESYAVEGKLVLTWQQVQYALINDALAAPETAGSYAWMPYIYLSKVMRNVSYQSAGGMTEGAVFGAEARNVRMDDGTPLPEAIEPPLKSALTKETPVGADSFAIVDSADANKSKRVTWASIITAIKTALNSVYVLATRKVNGKALTSDITLTAGDVGALPTTGGTMTGGINMGNNMLRAVTQLIGSTEQNLIIMTPKTIQIMSSVDKLIDVWGARVTGVATPVVSEDAANKGYVDEKVAEAGTGPSPFIFGSYVGDDTSQRVINIGFTPKAILTIRNSGCTYTSTSSGTIYMGGFAFTGSPIVGPNNTPILEIVDGGILVRHDNSKGIRLNYLDWVYYYIAFK